MGDNEGAVRHQHPTERINLMGIVSTTQQRFLARRAAATQSGAQGHHSEGGTSPERKAYNALVDPDKIQQRQPLKKERKKEIP
jgi:hypothetical protein